jgi:flavin-dependent dehydrogenase
LGFRPMKKTRDNPDLIASTSEQERPGSVPDHTFASDLTNPSTWGLDEPGGNSFTDLESSISDTASAASKLTDGSRVAVIGGGPAGSLFSYFLLKTLELVDTRIELDIYEPRDFSHSGPSGCNHCGGVVSESLIQILGAEGIILPSDVVQRGIDSYMMHMDAGEVRIDTPLHEKRIAAVYRGNGPRNAPPAMTMGFDRYLLELATKRGANWQRKMVTDFKRDGKGWGLCCADGTEANYDLLIIASGVNSALLPMTEKLGIKFHPPTAVKTFIAEFRLGEQLIEATFGTSMHVFLLDLPKLEFAALIPKGDYVTLCMLGDDIDEELVNRFLNSSEVRECFPENRVPVNACHCFPRINVGPALRPYDDRIVFIGDTGVARLYKDGIGSAYRTAKAAAMTCALHGISSDDFKNHYWSACRLITRDNAIGKLVFLVCKVIQKLKFTRRAVLRMVVLEQAIEDRKPRMSSVLWDVFSGSAPYSDVLLRTLHPAFLGHLVWNLLVANLPPIHETKKKVTVI